MFNRLSSLFPWANAAQRLRANCISFGRSKIKLFDETFYVATYELNEADAKDAYKHYMEKGWRAGLNPSPYFDTNFYLEANEDVRSAGINPLEHYVVHGFSEGRQPLQDGELSSEEVVVRGFITPNIEAAFNEEYFLNHYTAFFGIPKLKLNQTYLDLYLQKTQARLISPNPHFDEIWYRAKYPDVAKAISEAGGISGFVHFCDKGWEEGRLPSPFWFQAQQSRDVPASDCEEAIDEAMLIANDLEAQLFLEAFPFVSAEAFYKRFGTKKNGLKLFSVQAKSMIANLFDKDFYLEKLSDERGLVTVTDHFEHDYAIGRSQGISPIVDVKEAGYFDEAFYLKALARLKVIIPDGQSALSHYLEFGEENLISPSLSFDPKFYVAQYPDVHAVPQKLQHYLTSGKKEGRYANLADQLLSLNLGKSIYDYQCLPFVESGDRVLDIQNLQHLINIADVFDPSYWFSAHHYYLLNPDVKDANINALYHYLATGIDEGREAPQEFFKKIAINEALFDPKKPIIIVGAHELSKTGAPLVALNVAQSLKSRYNILFVAGKGGSLESSIDGKFFGKVIAEGNGLAMTLAIEMLQNFGRPMGALFSSIECQHLVEAMANLNIPSLMLIHEYTEYTYPNYKKYVPLLLCESIVYSSNHLKQSWINYFDDLDYDKSRVLVCSQPKTNIGGKIALEKPTKTKARKALAKALGTDNLRKKKIVIGAGQVQIRKGTDLFMQVADHITRTNPGEYLFVWIGEIPLDSDLAYGTWLHAYLNKKIKNNPDVRLIAAGEVYTTLQASADAFLLTSRLDPLPNVVLDALDALDAGQALFYFDDASGVREFIEAEGAHVSYASPYLDIFDMSEKIKAHFDSTNKSNFMKAKEASTMLEVKHSAYHNDYEGYSQWLVNSLEASTQKTAENFVQIRPKVDPNYVCELTSNASALEALSAPLENCDERKARIATQVLSRGSIFINPRHGLSGYNCVHNIDETFRSVCVDESITKWRDALNKRRVFVHIHAHYIELLGEILQRLVSLNINDNIIITTSSQAKSDEILEIAAVENANVIVKIVENCGRDIGPFLDVCGPYFKKYPKALFGHFHTKKSEFIDKKTASIWRDKLLRTLLNATALCEFADEKVGLIFGDEARAVGWGQNLPFALDLRAEDPNLNFNEHHPGPFPVGNMFWVNGQVAGEMRTITTKLVWPAEPIGYDGSVLHAIERLWPSVCEKTGYQWLTIYD